MKSRASNIRKGRILNMHTEFNEYTIQQIFFDENHIRIYKYSEETGMYSDIVFSKVVKEGVVDLDAYLKGWLIQRDREDKLNQLGI